MDISRILLKDTKDWTEEERELVMKHWNPNCEPCKTCGNYNPVGEYCIWPHEK